MSLLTAATFDAVRAPAGGLNTRKRAAVSASAIVIAVRVCSVGSDISTREVPLASAMNTISCRHSKAWRETYCQQCGASSDNSFALL